jgi:hypothetical protein
MTAPDDETLERAQVRETGGGPGQGSPESAWVEVAKSRLGDVQAGRTQLAPWLEARERIFARR